MASITCIKAQKNNTFYPFVENQLWGFIDNNRNIIIKNQYASVQNFEDGFAIVSNYCSEKGIIDQSGRLIIPMNFDFIDRMNQNYFRVERNDSVGIIDKNGKIIIPLRYNYLNNCGPYLFEANKNDKIYLMNHKGDKVSDLSFDNIDIKRDIYDNFIIVASNEERIIIFDSKGNKININNPAEVYLVRDKYFVSENDKGIETYFDASGKIYASKTMIPSFSCEPFEDSGFWGFKVNDSITQPAKYSDIIFLSGTSWAVKLVDKWGIIDVKKNIWHYKTEFNELESEEIPNIIFAVKDGKYGLISKHNLQTLLPFVYDYIVFNDLVEEQYDESYLNFSKNGKFGIMSTKGNIILPCEFDNIFLKTPPVIIAQKNNKYGLYLTSGKEIQPCIFDTIETAEFYDDSYIYFTHKDSLVGAYNSFGQLIANPIYEELNFNESEIQYALSAKRNSKYGIVLLNNFEFINCEYDEPIDLTEYSYNSYIPVIKNGKYGMLDSKGNVFINCEYDNQINSEMFYEKYAYAIKDGKNGLLDINGKLIIPCKYTNEIDMSYLYNSNRVVVEDSTEKFGIYDIVKGEIIPCILDEPPYDFMDLYYDYYTMISKGKYGLVDRNAKILVPFIYDNMYNEHENYNSGLYVVEKNEKNGLVNNRNEIIIPIEYLEININDEKSTVYYAGRNDKYCIYNIKGTKLTEEKYDYIIYLGESLSLAFTEIDSTIIDSNGKLFTNQNINSQTYFNEGLSPYLNNNKYGFIDTKGNIIIQAQYNEVSSFNEGLVAVKQNDKWGIINKKGKSIVTCQFDKIGDFQNGYAFVTLSNKMGIIDKFGKTIVETKFDDVDFETPTLFSCKLNDKYGLININGEVTTPAVFNRFHFYDTYIKGSTDSCEALIDVNGISVTDTIYDYIDNAGDLFIVDIKDKHGLINNRGRVLLPVEYDKIYFRDSAYFEIEKNNKYGVADLNGKIILPCIYDDLDYRDGVFYFKLLPDNGQKSCGIIPYKISKK